jgi:hypothetical protein
VFVARGGGTRTFPEPAGQAVVLGAHVAFGRSRSVSATARPPGGPILTFVTAGDLAQQTTLLMYTI